MATNSTLDMGRQRPAIAGLYAITMETADTARLVAMVKAALEGGAAVIQYRDKSESLATRHAQARALVAVCQSFGKPLMINDDLELALEVGADGLHLGRGDGDLAKARSLLGPNRLLGASCYDSTSLASDALALGADHVAFGSIFASGTKPEAQRAPLEIFARARAIGIDCPLVGIGGIGPQNMAQLVAAGASCAAVIGAVFGHTDDPVRIREKASHLAGFFPRTFL